MSNRLGGKQGTAYLGTNANQPPNWTFEDHDPSIYDTQNVSLGDLWLNKSNMNVFILVSLDGNNTSKGSLATWSKLESGGSTTGPLDTLTGTFGGAVQPDAMSNINLFSNIYGVAVDGSLNLNTLNITAPLTSNSIVLTASGNDNIKVASLQGNLKVIGDGVGITITGNASTNTLTASLIGGADAVEDVITDSGTASSNAGILNINAANSSQGAGSSVLFSGSGDTVELNVTDTKNNTIVGKNSGNAILTGTNNTVMGQGSFSALTTGSSNIAIGQNTGPLLTTGSHNILLGASAGSLLTTTDSNNLLIGHDGVAGSTSLLVIARGDDGDPFIHNYPGSNATTTNGGNLFVGNAAGNFTLNGGAGNASNNGFGTGTLQSLTSGARNNTLGSFALYKVTTGTNNIAIGHSAGFNAAANTGITTGTFNTLIGYTAGDDYTGAESNNIIIGGSAGIVGESNVLRIGDGTGSGVEQLNKAFISGIVGITPDMADGIPVFISTTTGQLGTVGSVGFISTLTASTNGVVVSPSMGNINLVAGAGITVSGSSNTVTFTATGGGSGTVAAMIADNTGVTVDPNVSGVINIISGLSTQNCGSTIQFFGDAASSTITLNVSDSFDNTIIGKSSGNGTLTGANNTILGQGNATALTNGSLNIVIGQDSGNSLTTASSNIIIGNGIAGATAIANELIIGGGTGSGAGEIEKAFISGIVGITPDMADGIPVFISATTGQLGTDGNGGDTLISTLTASSDMAVVFPSNGNITLQAGTGITISGSTPNTVTFTATGSGGGAVEFMTDSGNAMTASGVIKINTGNVSQNAGSSVSFSAPGPSNIVQFNVTDTNNNTTIGNLSGNGSITGTNNVALGAGTATALTTGSSNILLGRQAGSLITTGTGNFLCGDATLNVALKGTTTSTGLYGFGASTGKLFLHNWGGTSSSNTFVGYDSCGGLNAGQQAASRQNTALGVGSVFSLTSGFNNTAIGYTAGTSITTGSNNTMLGSVAGGAYTTNENSNVVINSTGVTGDANTLRIGQSTGSSVLQLNKAFIAGIRGITTTNLNALPVVIDSAGQLGTSGGVSFISTATGNTGGSVSASGGNINIRGDGTTATVVGSPGTNTLTISALGGSGGGTAGNPSFMTYLTNNSGPFPYSTYIQIFYDTLAYNLGGAFNLGTGIFTAPATGLYNFSATKGVIGGSNSRAAVLQLVTSNATILLNVNSNANIVTASTSGTPNLVLGNSTYVNMTAGDTALIQMYTFGGVGSYSIAGSSGTRFPGIATYFSGMRVS